MADWHAYRKAHRATNDHLAWLDQTYPSSKLDAADEISRRLHEPQHTLPLQRDGPPLDERRAVPLDAFRQL